MAMKTKMTHVYQRKFETWLNALNNVFSDFTSSVKNTD